MAASRESDHSCIGLVLNVKVVTLVPINYSVPGLSNIANFICKWMFLIQHSGEGGPEPHQNNQRSTIHKGQ